jgi:hypothetical protein
MNHLSIYEGKGPTNPIKIDGWNHQMEDKREGQRKGQKTSNPKEPKKGEG